MKVELEGLLEDGVPEPMQAWQTEAAKISIAISLKRIADVLETIDGRLEEMKYKGG